MILIRKAISSDIPAVEAIYDSNHDAEKSGQITTGGLRNVYPTEATASAAFQRDDLFVMEDNGQILASAIIVRVGKKEPLRVGKKSHFESGRKSHRLSDRKSHFSESFVSPIQHDHLLAPYLSDVATLYPQEVADFYEELLEILAKKLEEVHAPLSAARSIPDLPSRL